MCGAKAKSKVITSGFESLFSLIKLVSSDELVSSD